MSELPDLYGPGLAYIPTPRAFPDTHLADERDDILTRFTAELARATGDGSKKRRAGTKPPWYEDDSHEAAMFSHLMK